MQEPIICPNNIYINTTFNKQVDDWVEQENKFRAGNNTQLSEPVIRNMILDLFLSCIYPAGRA